MAATPTALPQLSAAAGRDWRSVAELTALGAIWGASFLFMRVSANEFGAVPLVEMRLALGALILFPFLWRARARIDRATWPRLALIGVLNSAVPFALFAWAAQRAPAGIGAITNSATVLFTALVAFAFFGERIGTRRAIALAAGFVGVVVLASGKVAGASVAGAALAGTAAAACYGVAANLIRRYLTGVPAAAVASATLVCAAVLLAPFAIATWPQQSPPAQAWAAAVALGVLCTGIAYAFYYRLIQRIGPARAVTVTYLVPLFGVGWAWLLLDEPLTWTMALGGALILAGVAFGQNGRGAAAAEVAPRGEASQQAPVRRAA